MCDLEVHFIKKNVQEINISNSNNFCLQFVVVNNTSEDEISSNSSGRASSSDEISCHGDPTFGVDVDDVDMDEVDVYVLLFERKKISSWKPTRISYSMLLLQGPFMCWT